MATFSFDPSSSSERELAYKVLSISDPSNRPDNLHSSMYQGINRMNYGDQSIKIKELEEANKGLLEKVEQDIGKIEELQKEADGYKSKCEEASRQINAKDEEIQKLRMQYSEEKEKADKVKNDLNDDIKEKRQNIEGLRKEIGELKRRLSEFIPNIGNGKDNQNWFMAIGSDGTTLKRSNIYEEPFKAIVSSNGEASFTFNVEKGPHREYCQNTQKLTPFCDIEEQIDGANRIVAGAYGKGHVTNNVLTVESKAKIKLVRE